VDAEVRHLRGLPGDVAVGEIFLGGARSKGAAEEVIPAEFDATEVAIEADVLVPHLTPGGAQLQLVHPGNVEEVRLCDAPGAGDGGEEAGAIPRGEAARTVVAGTQLEQVAVVEAIRQASETRAEPPGLGGAPAAVAARIAGVDLLQLVAVEDVAVGADLVPVELCLVVSEGGRDAVAVEGAIEVELSPEVVLTGGRLAAVEPVGVDRPAHDRGVEEVTELRLVAPVGVVPVVHVRRSLGAHR